MHFRSGRASVWTCAIITLLSCAACVQAAITIDSVTLNGGTSVNVTPSASITVSITVTLSSNDNWKGTNWNINSDTCVDHADHTTNNTFTENFNITAPATTGTYSINFTARGTNACGGAASLPYSLNSSIHVCSSPPSAPTSASVDQNNYCTGTVANSTLTSSGGSGTTLAWYSGSCGGTSVGTGTPLTISAPTSTTTYYARWETSSDCSATACASVTVTVNPLPGTPTSPSASPSTICSGSSSTISATVSGGQTVDWYTGSCGGTAVSGGASPSVSPTSTTTYYARARNTTTGCISAACATVTVTVNALPSTPTSPTTTPSTICNGASSTLSASVGGGETVDWFTVSCGGTAVSGGASPSVSPTSTTTYYARARNTTTSCVSAACATVTVTVNALPGTPTSPTATPSTICNGASSTLSASVGGGETVDWFTVSCGGTAVSGGASPTVSPTSTTTYYARARNTTTGCVSAACATVTVTVNALPGTPTSPSASPSTICSGASSTISATVSGGQTVDWYTGSCGGTSVGSGTSLSVSPTSTTTYYARARNTTTGCISAACATVTVTVNALPNTPTSPSASPSSICTSTSSTLSASVNAGETVDWFTVSCGGTAVSGGASPSVSPTSTTTYYARARNTTTGCVSSACASVTVTVNALPSTPTSVTASPSSVAPGDPSTLSATVNSGETVDWYTGSCGGTSVGSGTSIVVNPTSDTTYYARARNTTSGCVSTSCGSVTVSMEKDSIRSVTLNGASSVTVLPSAAITAAVTTQLTNGGKWGSTNWNISGDNCVNTTDHVVDGTFTESFSITAPSSPGTYGVTFTAYGNDNCGSAIFSPSFTLTSAIVVCSNATAPTSASVDHNNFCSGAFANIALTATGGSGIALKWYSGSCGGTLVGTGTPLTISAPTSTTTYYARWESSPCTNSTCASVTVTVNALPGTPTSPSASPSTICTGSSSTLSASVSGGETVDWYTGSCGGTSAGSGTSLSVSPTSTTTYYARARNTTTGCVSAACATVTVTVNSLPNTPTSLSASPSTICSGASSTISASVGGGEAVDWYTGSCGGTSAGTGTSLSVSPSSTTTYYARARNTTTGCVSAACASVTVTVNALPNTPTSPSASPSTICSGASSTISATVGGGETVDWYTGSCGGTSVGPGTSLGVSPTSTTTYYARARNTTTGCISAACASVTVTVNASPVAPTSASVDSSSYCSGSAPANITLTATGGSGMTLAWYIGSCGGTSVGTGTPLTISAPAATTTYYVRWETVDCGNSACASVTVTVDSSPVAPTSASADSPSYCSGSAPTNITLTATGGSGTTLKWYSGSCGGTLVGTGTPLTISAPGSTTTYYARWETASCGNSTCASVTVTVNASPAAPTSASVDSPTYCTGSAPADITLTATGGSGTTLKWYSGSCGGTLVGTGTPLTISAPGSTTTYYARWETASCGNSTCASVTVTVDASPVAPTSASVDSPSYCTGSAPTDFTLTATGGSGTTLKWYSGSCGGTLVGTGTPLTISAPGSTTTYYARWETASCGNSSCTSVAVTVEASPVAPSSASVDAPSYCSDAAPADITLTASGGSGTTIHWYSGSCGGTSVGTGTPLTISAPGSTTTYYARWETAGCGNSVCASVTVTVTASPVAPDSISVDRDNFCSDDSGDIELTAVGGSGGTLHWYSGSCGGTSVGTGTPLIIASPTVTTTYYARWETSPCTPSACASVTVTVVAEPVAPPSASVDRNDFCSDDSGDITLTATGGSGATLKWYSGSCGGTLVGTGTPLIIASPTATTTYYARWESPPCAPSACASVTVTVNALPSTPTNPMATPSTICSGDSSTLSVSVGAGETADWYTSSCGGTPAGSGTSINVSPASTTTYFARARNLTTGCVSAACASVTVTVSPTTNILVDVQLGGSGYPATLSRCIRFEVYPADCGAPVVVDQVVTFSSGTATGVAVTVPCGDYSCMTARDKLHTLRRTLAISGPSYTAAFTGAKALLGGNLNDDDYIDIIDFAIYANRYGTCYGAGCPGTPSGDTTCSTSPYHADISGNGLVGTEDFTFVQINFFKVNDDNCCGAMMRTGGPLMSITRAELQQHGLAQLINADLNRDGVVDQSDIAAFLGGARPSSRPVLAPISPQTGGSVGQ